MNRKLPIFISSTNIDLIDERQAAVEAILDAGHIPAGMELFKAGNSQLKTIHKWIDDSDAYLLILGGRYGSIDSKTKLSYTQLEYEYALSKKMPVFAIVLTDSMLHKKASKDPSAEIFETKNKKKYQSFKKIVESNVVRYANSISEIKSNILSQLNYYMTNSPNQFIGWIKGDTLSDNYETIDSTELINNSTKIIEELIARNTPLNISDFSQHFTANLYKNLDFMGFLDSVKRLVELEPIDEKMLKVTTTQILDYSYLKPEKCSFGHNFAATQQQAETLKVEQLLINNVDYTSVFKYEIERNESRGQFIYHIESNSIPIDSLPCNIFFKQSYICPALDFFQSSRLSFPCKSYSVSVIPKNDFQSKYSIIASTFSSFSGIHYDDFLASELKNLGICNISLPSWSLPGSGYVITVKNKSKLNHI